MNKIEANEFPYLNLVDKLKFSYPALNTVVHRLPSRNEEGRQLVQQHSQSQHGHPPGRCCVLEFRTISNASKDHQVEKVDLSLLADLQTYLQDHNPMTGDPVQGDCKHRLYLLEDLSPGYVDLLGRHLKVDPLVLASHLNSWRFQHTGSIAQRTLPSLTNPQQSFTVRYPELRSSTYREGLATEGWTFAANRRKIDPWFPIEGGPIKTKEDIAIVRHCLSFWVDQAFHGSGSKGWNALLLVDPAVDSYRTPHTAKAPFVNYNILMKQGTRGQTTAATHTSKPFRFGHPDPIPIEQALQFTSAFSPTGKPIWRTKQSLYDEIILYWTQNQTENQPLIQAALTDPCNTTFHALKIAAYNWTNMLDLIHLTLNQAEFLAGEARAPLELFTSDTKLWKRNLRDFYDSIWFLNVFRRRLAFYEDDLDLVLERLNPFDLAVSPNSTHDLPLALRDATLDFKSHLTRLRLYKSRVESLSTLSDTIVNMRQAAKGLEDGAFNLKLAVFAAIVFPGTFVAALFSMAEGFRPGDHKFWVYWVVSVPLVVLVVGVLLGRGEGVGRLWRGLRGGGGKKEKVYGKDV